MNSQSPFRFRLTTMGIVMIPVAVGINYIGKYLAQTFSFLPVWLDSIGTILAAVIAGPWIGAISGAVNNVFFGLTVDSVSMIYGITSIAIAIIAGILGILGWFRSLPKAILAGILIAITSAVVSTPLNVWMYGGQTGKPLGDAIYVSMMANHFGIWLSSFVDELVMDLIDKIVVAIIVFLIFIGLPRRFVQSFQR